jgi:serine/threonine-protein kinase
MTSLQDSSVLTQEPQAPPQVLPIGAKVGPYQIRRELGRGGMGVVYEALDTALGRAVALKVLPLQRERGREALKRFVLEARTLAKLDHPNITAIYSHGRCGDLVYLASQLVRGVTLGGIVEKDGPLGWRRALSVARDIAAALAAAHAAGVLHRDIKSDNVMVDDSGRVKLVDFGIARDFRVNHRITQEHHCVGTAEYCAPEQLRAEELDGRADLYSLGVVLYEMLTAKVPHQGRSTVELYENIKKHPVRSPRSFDPGIPRAVAQLTRKLLNRDRSRRFRSAAETVAAIEILLAKASLPRRSPIWTRLWRRDSRSSVAALGVLLGCSAGTGAALTWVLERLLA